MLARPAAAEPTDPNHYLSFITSESRCGRAGRAMLDAVAANTGRAETFQLGYDALAAEEQASGRDSAETNICVLNLGLLASEVVRGRGSIFRATEIPEFDQAQTYFLRAVESAGRTHGEGHREHVIALNYLISFYLYLDLTPQRGGSELKARALELINLASPNHSFDGPDDPRIATLQLYADTLNEGEERAELLTRILAGLEAAPTPSGPRIYRLYETLTGSLNAAGRHPEAVAMAERWVAFARNRAARDARERPRVQDAQMMLALAYRDAGMTAQADALDRQMRSASRSAAGTAVPLPPSVPPVQRSPVPPPPLNYTPPAASATPPETPQESAPQEVAAYDLQTAALTALREHRYAEGIDAAERYLALCREIGFSQRGQVCYASRYELAGILAVALTATGRGRDAVTMIEAAIAAVEPERRSGREPFLRFREAQARRSLGEIDRAETIFSQLIQRQSTFEVWRERSMIELAQIYIETGRIADAENLLGQLPERLDSLLSEGALGTDAELQRTRAMVLVARGQYADAQARFEGLLAGMLREHPNGHPVGSELKLQIAQATGLAGQGAQAVTLYRQAIGEIEARFGGDSVNAHQARSLLAEELLRQGRFDEAVILLKPGAEALSAALGETNPVALRAASDWLTAAWRSGRAGEPEIARAERHMAALRAFRLAGGASQPGVDEARRFATVFAHLAWGAGAARARFDRAAFLALQDAAEGDTDEYFRRRIAREAAGRLSPRLAELVRRRDQLQDRSRETADTRATLLSLTSASFDTLFADTQAEAARAELASLTAQIERDFPPFAALMSQRAVDVDAVRRVLRPGEALLLAVPTEQGTQLMLVRDGSGPGGVHWTVSDLPVERARILARRIIADASGSFVGSDGEIDEWRRRHPPGRPSFDRAAAFELYREIVNPFEGQLEGVTSLQVAAAGPLSGLPFSLLVTRPPEGADDSPAALRATAWLADRYAISHLPSAQSLVLLRCDTCAPANAAEPLFVGIGNPVLNGEPSSRGRRGAMAYAPGRIAAPAPAGTAPVTPANVSALASLSRLPGTEAEIDGMARLFGTARSALLRGPLATEANVRSTDLSRANILLFATHGLLPEDTSPAGMTASEIYGIAEPGLVLTPPSEASAGDDGFLSAGEVATLRLNADLVILSACNTATTQDPDGQGMSALARAFFYAGARSLIASYWLVDDAAAGRLTTKATQLFLTGTPRAQALGQAMRELRTGGEQIPDEWAHPFYWAPFVLIGDGAR